MEPRQLEAFAAVMTTGSITGAARLLARSQPAVTRLVQELESEVGYALFTRHGPRVTPTPQAFLLHEDAERALAGLRQIHVRAAEIGRGEAAPMVIAATSALAVGLLPFALKRAETKTGILPIQLRTAAPEEVLHAVLTGAVALGICSFPLAHHGLQAHWIAQVPCVAVLAQADPLARRAVVPLAALAQQRIVTMSNPFRLRHRLDAELAKAGCTPDRRAGLIETNSSTSAQALVRAGLGVAVLEPLTAHGAPLSGLVVRPLDTDIPFFFGVVTSPSRPVSPAVQALVDALLETAEALPGFVRRELADHARLLDDPAPRRPRARSTAR